MPAFLVPIHESNDCHAPAGSPAGGQFCSKTPGGWHLTSDPHFVPDPTLKPEWNSLGGDLMGDARPAGVFVGDVGFWLQAHGYERPYVAELEGGTVSDRGAMYPGREALLQGDVRVKRVLTLDEYAREKYGQPGWVETDLHALARLTDRSLPLHLPKLPKGYKARSVAEMTPEELAEWERKFARWTQRAR